MLYDPELLGNVYGPRVMQDLAAQNAQASKKWAMSIRNYKSALNRFMIVFEDRLKDVI